MQKVLFASCALGALALSGCMQGPPGDGLEPTGTGAEEPVRFAGAPIHPLSDGGAGGEIAGYALFHAAPGGVWVHVAATGLDPGGHAMHVHAGASCDAPGPHFSPGNGEPAAGDLPTLNVSDDGRANAAFFHPGLSALAGETDVAGRTLVIHEGAHAEEGPMAYCAEILGAEGLAAEPLAVARLMETGYEGPARTGNATGVASFVTLGNATHVAVFAHGLAPGKHGTHVHENPRCEATEEEGGTVHAGAAGGHFNPTNASHGEHAGDLPNLRVGEEGTGNLAVVREEVTLEAGAEGSIRDRSVVVHAEEDDFATDPAGASGARVLCGVIPAL